MTLDDIDLVEINEAFAPVVLAWAQEHHPDMEQGQRQRRRDRARSPARLLGRAGSWPRCSASSSAPAAATGLQTMCEGGGMANATIIERLG